MSLEEQLNFLAKHPIRTILDIYIQAFLVFYIKPFVTPLQSSTLGTASLY